MEDEYQLEDLEVVAADYMQKVGVSNFRNAWESMDPDSERVDEYGLGPRESLAEAVSAVINLLGMQPCEVLFFLVTLDIYKLGSTIEDSSICMLTEFRLWLTTF